MEKKMNDVDVNVEFFFPLEIMFEIFKLSRLTVASLLRCKCCKQWNEIIQHPKFIQMQMTRSSRVKFYYNSTKDFNVLICYHGLLLEQSKISGTYRIENPATRQVLVLPNLKEKPINWMIVFLESTNSYKLVFILDRTEGSIGNIGFKVLSVGGSDLSWRDLGNSCLCKLDRMRQRLSVIVNGRFIYCVGFCKDGSTDSQMYCLDVENEILTGVSPIIVPRSFFSNWKNARLVKWGGYGKVAVMNIVEEDLHVWVLEDPIKGNWAKKMIIIPLAFLKENPDLKGRLVLNEVASPEEIWFRMDGVQLISYHIRSKKLWKSKYSAPSGKIIMYGTCSLVTLKGMQPFNGTQPKKKPKSDAVEVHLAKHVDSLRRNNSKMTRTTIILIMLVACFACLISF